MENEYDNDFNLCNKSYCSTSDLSPQCQLIILLIVIEIIFEILLKYEFGNQVNENDTKNEIRLESKLKIENVNVNSLYNGYEYSLPYTTPAAACSALLEFTFTNSHVQPREQLIFNHLDDVNGRCAQDISQSKLYQCVCDLEISKNKRVLQQTHAVSRWYTLRYNKSINTLTCEVEAYLIEMLQCGIPLPAPHHADIMLAYHEIAP